MISELSGGDFMQGFAAGGLGSLGGSAFMMYGGSFAASELGTYAFSGLAGGAGSALTGGNFWEGAAIGVMNAGLNHLQQKTEEYKFFWRLKKHYSKGSGKDFKITRDEFKYLLKKGKINYENAKEIGNGYYSTTIDFYNSNQDLKFSFGRASITYKVSNGKYVYNNFYDRYDFDPKPWGTRSVVNEIITRAYNLSKGKPFDIYYKKYKL